jgi:GTPase SAR1 family protein
VVWNFLRKFIQGSFQEEESPEALIKICVLSSGILKRRMIGSFTNGKFDRDYYTIHGLDITTRSLQVNDQFVKLIVADPNPSEFFRKLRPSYYRGSSAVLFVFEKGDKSSFETVKYWYDEFMKYFTSSLPMGLVGLITQPEKITFEAGQRLAVELGARYYETIVDDSKYIEHIFRDLTLEVLRKKEK